MQGEPESKALVSGCAGEDRNIAIQSKEHCDTDATLLQNGTFHFPDLFDDSLAHDSYEEPEEYRVKRSSSAVLANFSVNTESSAIFESERGCSVLTSFTMKTEDRATFEWENGKVVGADLTKENDECIYR